MNKPALLLTFFVCLLSTTLAQQRMRIMEWNVENMFDTIHCAGKQDSEFTPTGSYGWNTSRYWTKLSRIARTIAAVGEESPCDLVALVEVENDSVMQHLTRRTKLWRMGYEYIMASTSDVRGISVALLYQPHHFRPVSIDTLHFSPPKESVRPTRDALHVAGETTTGDTLDIIVCHWPSRRDGKTSQRFREKVGRQIRTFCDSIFSRREKTCIVITGDFNAWYPEKCITKTLGATLPSDERPSSHSLYILSHRLHAGDIEGTYKYQGAWNRLDQFIVSGALLEKDGSLRTTEERCRIADLPFLLQTEKDGSNVRPFRTFLGSFYQGGYSDHLPLVLDLFY